MPRSPLVLAVFALAFALLPRPALAAWSHDPSAQLAICAAPRQQQYVNACGDGAGGAMFVWEDHRDSLTVGVKLFMQHVSRDGVLCSGWPVNGLAVCSAAGDQTLPTIAADGSGGAFVAWQDSRVPTSAIYVQHVQGTGAVAPGWPATGVAVSNATNLKGYSPVISDGGAGAIVAWRDDRDSLTSGPDIYAQHVLGSGVVDPAWPAYGRAVCTANGVQNVGAGLVSDGAGGAFISWQDGRNSLTTVVDIYASHVLANGSIDPAVPLNGTPVCVTSGNQYANRMASDGAGGAYVVWFDLRIGTDWRIYMHHLRPNGTVDPVWPANGLGVCNVANSNQELPLVVGDGAGGAIAAWTDNRTIQGTYAQHVLVNGTQDPAWPASGVLMSSATAQSSLDGLIADGSGGALASWEFFAPPTFTPYSEYAGHLLSTGVPDPTWPAGGRQLTTVPVDPNQSFSALVSDGAGGAIVAWQNLDGLLPFSSDIYAGRVSFNGILAPEPVIASVRDVPADQGGEVIVRWNPSWLDTLPTYPIASYDLWRRLSGAAAQRAHVTESRALSAAAPGAETPRPGSLRITLDAGTPVFWEYIASVPAVALGGYAYMVATSSDSVAAGIPWNDFMVDARSTTGSYVYSSAADSGYSVDNLAPATPAQFVGAYSTSTGVTLQWAANHEADLAGYYLYRGVTAGFTPSVANRLAALTNPYFTDAAAAPAYYKLSAFDLHGNESGFASLLPSGTLAAPPQGTAAFALDEPRPNPMRGARLEIGFALPEAASARLELVDSAGRRLASREVGSMGVGRHVAKLETVGRIAAGLYFVQLTQGTRVGVRRVVVLE